MLLHFKMLNVPCRIFGIFLANAFNNFIHMRVKAFSKRTCNSMKHCQIIPTTNVAIRVACIITNLDLGAGIQSQTVWTKLFRKENRFYNISFVKTTSIAIIGIF